MILYICAAFLFGIALGAGWSWLHYRHSYDGFMHVIEDEDRKIFSLVLLDEPETLEGKELVVFKVKHEE